MTHVRRVAAKTGRALRRLAVLRAKGNSVFQTIHILTSFESLAISYNVGEKLQLNVNTEMVTGAQLRAARALLNVSVAELAETTGLAVNTIRRAEGTNGQAPITAANMKLLLTMLGQAGVLFIPADALGPGVRLASPDTTKMRLRKRDLRSVA